MRIRTKQNLLASFRHAFEGVCYVIRNERNARIHVVVALVIIALSLWLGLDWIQWALILTAIGIVFAGEMVNTVVELSVDMLMPQQHQLAGSAKDVAAGAILVFSLTAAAIGALVLGPLLLARFGWL